MFDRICAILGTKELSVAGGYSMSLHFIIGRAGSGKSSLILSRVAEELKADPTGPPLIILTPEQGTFQIEQQIAGASGLPGTVRTQVLGFRRLALRVMQETGGSALVPIHDEGKKMLLYKLLRRHRDNLRLFGQGGDQFGLIERIAGLYTEMKKYNVDFADLSGFETVLESRVDESPLLIDKMHDLALLFAEFDMELSKLYIDNEDHVVKLAQGAPESAYLRGAKIWIDGFHTFTPQEYTAIVALLKASASVTVSLTLDRPYDDGNLPQELNLFHTPAAAYVKLRQLAQEAGIDVAAAELLDQRPYPRFQRSETLEFLESAYERRTPWGHAEPPKDLSRALSIHRADGRRAEVEGAVREMVRLAREEGVRWREMGLLVRRLEDYDQLIAPMMEEYEVPFFLDQKTSMLHHPLIEFIRSALDVVLGFWKYDDVFRCIKSEFLLPLDGSLTREDMDVLENYVLASGIQGYRWFDGRPWKGAPSLSLEQGEAAASGKAQEQLDLLERCRSTVVAPLYEFEKRLKQAATATEMCAAVYQLLVDAEAAQHLDLLAHRLLQSGQPRQAMEHRQLWGSVLDLLDQIAEMMGDERLEPELFAGVLETGMKGLKLALVPPSLDQVLVGSTDRTRSGSIKHLFLLGINEGVMPAGLQEEGLLSEQEKQRLSEVGLELAPGLTRDLLDERFLIYGALTGASDSLWLSYAISDGEGGALLPSEVIRQVKRIFPLSAVKEQMIGSSPFGGTDKEELAFVAKPGPALATLIRQLRRWRSGESISPLWWHVLEWYKDKPEWESRAVRLVGSLNYRNRVRGLTPATSRKLYGKRLRTSVSRMEQFSACPFAHFASHGLKLKERQLYRLKAPDIGQLFHAALSQMAINFREQNLSWGSLTPEEVLREADAAVDDLAPKLQGEILLSSKRYGYISRKLKNIVGRASLILGEQARRGSFEPIGLELDFGPGRPLPPLIFELPNGCVMEIVGRIDRVDVAEGEDGLLLRVIDYKSSQTDLKLHEVYYGLSLQMLTYLDVLVSSAEEWLGESALPAGTLYFHVHNPLLQSSNGMSSEQARQELLKRFKMKGLLLADREVIAKMDSSLEKGHSEILPVAIKADGGFYSSASVATPEQWKTLLTTVRHTIADIGTRITDGDVQIAPYRLGLETACAFCPYKPVCRFEESLEGSSYHVLNKPGKQEIWQLLGEDDGKETNPS